MASRIHSNGGPRKAPQPSPRSAPAPPTSGPTTADWVSGTMNQNQPELRRLKKKQKEKARRQRRGEGRRNMAQENKQLVGGAQHEASAEKPTHQTADPAATRRRTEDVGGSSNQVVAVVVGAAAVAEDIQVVVGRSQNEPPADNKVQAADLAVTRCTEDVCSTSQVAAAAVEAEAPSSSVAVAGSPPASSFLATTKSGTANNKQALARLRLGSLLLPLIESKFRKSRSEEARKQVSMSLPVEAVPVVAAAPPLIVPVVEPPSSSASSVVATTARDIAANQQALARLRLGSLLLPLIQNKLRRLKAGGNQATTEQQAAKAVEEAGENASPKLSAAEMAVMLRAEAVRLQEVAVAAKAFVEECADKLAEQLRLEERLLEEVTKQLDTRAQELSFKKKTCGLETLDEADRVFEEMYTGKAPAKHVCAHDDSDDSGNTYTIDSSESTGDEKGYPEGPGSEGQMCLPPSAARSPMPPVRQMHAGESALGTGMCSSATPQHGPPQALTGDESFADMCPAPVLPMQQYAPPPMAYGGDATYPVQTPHEQPLHTAYRGSTEGSMLYPLEVPPYQQPFGTIDSEGYLGWGLYNQSPMGHEGGGW